MFDVTQKYNTVITVQSASHFQVYSDSLFECLKCHCTPQQKFGWVWTQCKCIITVGDATLAVTELHQTGRSVAV